MHGMPEYGLTEEQKMMRESVLGLLQRLLPEEKVLQLDEAGEFPYEAYDALVEQGWMALPFDEKYGGLGGSYADLAVFIETIAYHWIGVSTAYLTTTTLGGGHIKLYGSEEQKQEFIPRIISGEIKTAFSLTEPGAGSDAAAIRTRAQRRGDDWVINGSKVYTTGAHVADYLVVATKTDPDAGHRGISQFIVDTKQKGVTIRPLRQLGRRAVHTNEVFFEDVAVPAGHLLGEENRGWHNLMRGLNLERMIIAATHCGNCQRVIDYVKAYAVEREQFGQPITKFQAIAHKMADMQIMAEQARLITHKVAKMMDEGLQPVQETAMAKIIATENNIKIADHGMQIMGGAGYMMDHAMQMHYRDCRVGPIGGGANEIQRTIIAKTMGL